MNFDNRIPYCESMFLDQNFNLHVLKWKKPRKAELQGEEFRWDIAKKIGFSTF